MNIIKEMAHRLWNNLLFISCHTDSPLVKWTKWFSDYKVGQANKYVDRHTFRTYGNGFTSFPRPSWFSHEVMDVISKRHPELTFAIISTTRWYFNIGDKK